MAEENAMSVVNWVRWNRSELEQEEREKLLGGLTPEQSRRLLENDFVWVDRVGVIWRPPSGGLRRQRFTHSADFATRHGSFRVDSEGALRESSAEREGAVPGAGR
jgi:hypothetical protein